MEKTIEVTTPQLIIGGLCFLAAAAGIAYSIIYVGYSLRQASLYESKAEVAKAIYGESAARYSALSSHMNLETIRTNVEKANRRALMAEYKLQALCKKKRVC